MAGEMKYRLSDYLQLADSTLPIPAGIYIRLKKAA